MKTSTRLLPTAFRLGAAIGVLTMLSGCGAVELLASGISDGTKYVIRKVEESGQEESPAPGMVPASSHASPPASGTGAVAPASGAGAATPAAPATPATAAPVMPVSRGEPL